MTAVAEGSVGVGAGATVGKMLVGRGLRGMKGGIGTTSVRLGDVTLAALAVVNAAGDVLDWRMISGGLLTLSGITVIVVRERKAAATGTYS